MLIYIELDLIDKFDEKSLANFFYNSHLEALKESYNKANSSYGRGSLSFIQFLMRIYRSYGLRYFVEYTAYLKVPQDINADQDGKGHYVLPNRTKIDFVQQWYDYIHLVE